MTTVLGYGEDALSLWALTGRTSNILDALGDTSPASDAVIFYRPSFGRYGSAPVLPGGVADSAQFGEFDAILGTPAGVYLIEAKWSRSSEIEGDTVVLRAEQIRRHKIFRAYLAAWRAASPANWSAFLMEHGMLLKVGPISVPVAPPGSQLARNLETVLSRLSKCGATVTDVLLYVRLTNGRAASAVRPLDFRFVIVDCPSEAGFVEVIAPNHPLRQSAGA